jgi:exonuclease SbcC
VIERLILKDFRSHEYSNIEFNQGLNIFLGEVGAGKTSIFEAISFALFGKYAGKINQSGLIRRGAEKAEISLIFSTNSGRYKLDRTMYPEKAQEAKMCVFDGNEWKLAVERAEAISKSVEDLLDLDTSTFLAAIYASQGEIKEMLEAQPGKRRERLDKLLGIDMYASIWKTLGDSKTIVLTELTQAQDKASGVEVLERQLEDLKARIEGSKKELSDLKSSLKEIDEKFKPTEQRLKELNDLRERVTTVRTQIEGKLNEIGKSTDALKSLKERQERANKAANVFEGNKEFIDLEKNLEDEKRQVGNLLQQKRNFRLLLQRDEAELRQSLDKRDRLAAQLKTLESLRNELEILNTEKEALPKLRTERTKLEERLDELKVKLVKASNEIENQKKMVERVTELGECPTCLQTVPDEHKERIRKETSEIIVKLAAGQSTLDEAQGQIHSELEDFREKIERAEEADKKYVELSTKIYMLQSRGEELEEIESWIESAKVRIAEKDHQIEEIKETPETLLEIDKKLGDITPKANLAREAEKLSAAKKDIDEMLLQEEKNMNESARQLNMLKVAEKELGDKYDAEEYEEKEREVKSLGEGKAKAAEGITRLEKTIEKDAYQMEEAKKALEEKKEGKKKVDSLKFESGIIDGLRQSLRDVVQPIMRKNNVLTVSEAFRDFYQELSNDSIDYAILDEEGNIDITRNGEPSPVNSLSGGETTCAALAFRLAICSGLTKNQLLLLDEPTIHLDEEYRAKLRDFLGSHIFEQLIVVTHDNTFDSLPAKIFRVEKMKGRSVVSPLQIGGV